MIAVIAFEPQDGRRRRTEHANAFVTRLLKPFSQHARPLQCLIQLVAALNILITLVMMVMEKQRDIAILVSMGARKEQIRKIFMMQGVIIGAIGSTIGLVAGYSLSILANKYQWIRLDEEVYSLAFVPFEPRWIDAIWIAAAAILVSFLATIYPARNATRISPVESLRYE